LDELEELGGMHERRHAVWVCTAKHLKAFDGRGYE